LALKTNNLSPADRLDRERIAWEVGLELRRVVDDVQSHALSQTKVNLWSLVLVEDVCTFFDEQNGRIWMHREREKGQF
jgi:hypothetical protein